MDLLQSFELCQFNLLDRVYLGSKYGLKLILKSDDGKIVLVTDGTYKIFDETNPPPATIANLDAAVRIELLLDL